MANEGSPANPSLSGAQILAKLLALGALGAAFTDSAFAIVGSGDATKIARFEVDGFTTGTTRTFTLPDASITVAGINLAQTWSATQTFAAINATSVGAVTPGTGAFTTLGGTTITASVLLTASANTNTDFNGLAVVNASSGNSASAVGYYSIGGSSLGFVGAFSASYANAALTGRYAFVANSGATALLISANNGTQDIELTAARKVSVTGTTDASAVGTASVVLAGGLGVAKAVFIGGLLNVAGTFSVGTASSLTAAGVLTLANGTSGSGSVVLNDTSVAGGNERSLLLVNTGASSKYNWKIGAQVNINNAFEITPSTAAGGSTYSTPALSIAGASGNVTLGAELHVVSPIYQDAGASDAGFVANSNAATNRSFWMFTAGSPRWRFYANSTAEGGSNAGSDFALAAYTDGGSLLDNPLTIARVAAGDITIASGRALKLGNAYVGTPQVGTGYVTIKDSTGTTYKVLVAT